MGSGFYPEVNKDAILNNWDGLLKHPDFRPGRWRGTFSKGWDETLKIFLDDDSPLTRICDARYHSMGAPAEREILIALQPIKGFRKDWEAIADQIKAAPPTWRWWIRRHPSFGRPDVKRILEEMESPDEPPIFCTWCTEYESLTALQWPNVMIGALMSKLPIWTFLRHMDISVSLYSGSSIEAKIFGVPTLFLCEKPARHLFGPDVPVVDIADLNAEIARRGKPDRARSRRESLERMGRSGNKIDEIELAAMIAEARDSPVLTGAKPI